MQALDPLYLFVFVGLFSPGPNIILLSASGATFGFRRTIPHILGVACGVGVIAFVAGAGVGAALLAMPSLAMALRILAAAWILWMAWSLLRRSRSLSAKDDAKPFTYVQAVLFQWVNPKVWAVAIAASAAYGLGMSPSAEGLRLALVLSTINLCVCTFWTWFGSLLSQLLRSERAWRIFMTVMAVALAASAVMVFL